MNRRRVLAAFARTRWGWRFRSRAALERHQEGLLARQLRFLAERSPLFRAGADAGPVVTARGEIRAHAALADLPLMDKGRMMATFNQLNTVGVLLADVESVAFSAEHSRDFTEMLGEDIAVGLSSGTSGHRGVFVTSQAERDEWAGTVLALTLPRGRLWGHRIALFLRADNELYQTVHSRAVDFRFYDTHGDLAAHARDLAAYRPTILVGPPSVLRVVADHLGPDERVRPQRLLSVAEVLTDADAAALAETFGQRRVHQLYQCTEGLLARTCEEGTLHLNEEFVVFEREVVEGRRFIPIVTDLRRRTQPIVRYRLNDILVERATPCPCGGVTTALERIEGREDDALVVSGVTVFADMVTRAIIRADGFTQYRVRQYIGGGDRLEIALDDLSAQGAVTAVLEELWERLGVAPPLLEFVTYTHDVTQKLRRVQRVREENTV